MAMNSRKENSMSTEKMKINERQVEVLKAVSYMPIEESGDYHYDSYYIGFCDKYGIACRLSPYFRTRQEAYDVLKSGDYVTEVSVLEYPNGSKLYFAEGV